MGCSYSGPVGKFSDGRDRRRFMFAVNILLAAVCTVIAITGAAELGLIGLAIVFGGLSSALYPLAVAYTNDYLEPENLVPAAGGLVMAYGIGAIAVPPMAALSIEFFGAVDLFLFCGFVATGAAGLIFWRMRQFEALSLEDQGDFLAVPRTSPVASELDPRGNFDSQE